MQSGIYSITHKASAKRYIGQANNFIKRFSVHISTLRNNKHDNKYLQNAWNKYGQEAFEFVILEYVNKEYVAQREQWWMDLFGAYIPEYGFNINPSSTENVMWGQTHTPEARKKISDSRKGRVMTEEYKLKMSETTKNKVKNYCILSHKTTHSPKREDYARNAKYIYYLTTTEGTTYTFTNLAKFCRENSFSNNKLAALFKHGTFYKGWSGYREKVGYSFINNIEE